ncbi:MAG TPA: hypothetical protein VKR62_17525, partial [Roseiarcus sp.]|nr:hypothetical protein [Roseiarcus sp.]
MSYRIPDALIAKENARLTTAQDEDYAALGRRLERAGADIESITAKVAAFAVAVPTWGVGTGGTRFARFPGLGEPRGIFDKLEDCATIHQLTRATPACSPHFPWDKVDDYRELAERAAALGVGFDAVNSNTFQDAVGQKLSYKFGSLAHEQKAVGDQAVAHNVADSDRGAPAQWRGDRSDRGLSVELPQDQSQGAPRGRRFVVRDRLARRSPSPATQRRGDFAERARAALQKDGAVPFLEAIPIRPASPTPPRRESSPA